MTECNEKHSHVLLKRKTGVYHSDRILQPHEKKEVHILLECKTPIRCIIPAIKKQFGKTISRKDIVNMRQLKKKKEFAGRTDEEHLNYVLNEDLSRNIKKSACIFNSTNIDAVFYQNRRQKTKFTTESRRGTEADKGQEMRMLF